MKGVHGREVQQIRLSLSTTALRKSCSILSSFMFSFPAAMSAEAQLTPMMAQYRRIKGELPKDTLLLFRLGDFYEMFFEDAQTGAQLLNLSLTARNGVPMCGLPFHAANNYIARILRAGRKVAICEQMEDARPGQLVKREVTQILSPGTHFDERMLVAERNNFLAAVCPSGKILGLALVDLTTGDFLTTELENDSALLAELERLRPAEIIFPTEAITLRDLLSGRSAPLTPSLSPSNGERDGVRGALRPRSKSRSETASVGKIISAGRRRSSSASSAASFSSSVVRKSPVV